MKRPLPFLALCCSLIVTLLLNSFSVKANNAAGGEIIYEWISGSTYRFYFKLYRDCAGNPPPATQPLCFNNTCNATNFTVTLALAPTMNPANAKTPCGYKSICDSPSSTLPGYNEVWYTNTATLPAQCSLWRIFTYISTRSSSNNILNPGSSDMYIEATFNNTGSYEGNSSPYFSIAPIPFFCAGANVAFNSGAADPNHDSLVTEVIMPRMGVTNCSGTPTNASFATATPSYNLTGNPIQTNNTFALTPGSGLISMTPGQTGANTLAIRVKEYRNGVQIGSVMREVPVNVITCIAPSLSSHVDNVSGGLLNGPGVAGCVTLPLSYTVDVKSSNPAVKLSVSDDSYISIPGAVTSYTNQNKDSVRMLFNWTPGLNDAGNKVLKLTVMESSCLYPGVPFISTITIPMYVNPPITASNDTLVCASTPVQLKVQGATNYQWNILSGDPNSLTCSVCPSPIAKAGVKTAYEVISLSSSFCPLSRDTVILDVIPINVPSLTIAANPDTNVTTGMAITFTATTTNCTNPEYQWKQNGVDIQGANSNTYVLSAPVDMTKISCELKCKDTCSGPVDTFSNMLTIHVFSSIAGVEGISQLSVYPNPSTGSFYIKGVMGAEATVNIEVLNAVGQVVYKDEMKLEKGAVNKQVQLADMPDGVYLLRMNDDSGLQTIPLRIAK